VESGAKERRGGLDALRATVTAGGVGTILVYRLDRIARDVLIAETLYREWTRAGVRIVSVSEAMLDDSLSGRLLRTILAGFAEYERAVIALRTSSGRKARVASAGTFHGGGVPYGYRATGDRHQPGHGVLAVDERHAEAVRLAFRLHDETRMTLKEIAAALNVDCAAPPTRSPCTAPGGALRSLPARSVPAVACSYRIRGRAARAPRRLPPVVVSRRY